MFRVMGKPSQKNQIIGNLIMVEVVVNADMISEILVVDVVKCARLCRREFIKRSAPFIEG